MSKDIALTDDQAWAAVLRRDRSCDGQFVTGVLSTGIYCRPSCAARHPARRNVRFFANGELARAAGLRPCKRCHPDDMARETSAVLAAIDAIRSGEGDSLADLAAITGYAPTHFQRLFKRATGLSPAAYARALRDERAREILGGAARVSHAIYDAGYEAPSRFYAAMEGRMGMSPSAWKDGGRGVRIAFAIVQTTLGPMLVAATDKGVCRLSFNEGEAELRARFPEADLVAGDADFTALLARVIAAVEVPGSDPHIPLDVRGTAFQERIWQELRRIPSGETRSYAQLAAAAGRPRAVRAAGSANGANNVAVLIPCHRVIRSDGSTGGYAYGTAIKEELLHRERASDASDRD